MLVDPCIWVVNFAATAHIIPTWDYSWSDNTAINHHQKRNLREKQSPMKFNAKQDERTSRIKRKNHVD